MDSEVIENIGINNLHPVFGRGLRGETLAAARNRPEMFDLLDRGDFYISCQQGKHHTDIALALYYFFHNDAEIPIMHGHRRDGVFRCDDILRRVNSMRPYFADVTGEVFSERRERSLALNRTF